MSERLRQIYEAAGIPPDPPDKQPHDEALMEGLHGIPEQVEERLTVSNEPQFNGEWVRAEALAASEARAHNAELEADAHLNAREAALARVRELEELLPKEER